MPRNLKQFLNEDTGAVAIEYGLIASLIGAALIPVLDATGLAVRETFEEIGSSMRRR